MIYKTLTLDDSMQSIELAGKLLRNGEVVAIPTETVYGLAANAFDEAAVAKIFSAKGRPADNPLIVHICEISQISDIAAEIPQLAADCAEAFWGGPLTMVLPKKPELPYITSGGLDTVGIRMPSHETARAIIKAAGVPLAAPSANLSGSPSPTSASDVLADMRGRIPAIVDGGECDAGVESTVISVKNSGITILRPGRITREMLLRLTPNVSIDRGVLHEVDSSAVAASPGMKYKHYSPAANVLIISGSAEKFAEYVCDYAADNPDKSVLCLTFSGKELDGASGRKPPQIILGESSEQQAHRLFSALREADRRGAKTVFARCPEKIGVGLAVYNRLIRAAGFEVIEL